MPLTGIAKKTLFSCLVLGSVGIGQWIGHSVSDSKFEIAIEGHNKERISKYKQLSAGELPSDLLDQCVEGGVYNGVRCALWAQDYQEVPHWIDGRVLALMENDSARRRSELWVLPNQENELMKEIWMYQKNPYLSVILVDRNDGREIAESMRGLRLNYFLMMPLALILLLIPNFIGAKSRRRGKD